jgi:RNA polymerase sigma-70 factor (ECF subfamily)
MSLDEADLIDAARRGDAAPFARLVAIHQGRVRAYIAGFIRRPDVADDLAQEVFLTAFRGLDGYQRQAPFGIWLLGIARKKTLVHLRGEWRRLKRESDPVAAALTASEVAALEADELHLVRRERELIALQRCLETLPAPGARIVAERYFEARGIGEIAQVLGKREGAVRMTLSRVRQLLRECVERRLAEPVGHLT